MLIQGTRGLRLCILDVQASTYLKKWLKALHCTCAIKTCLEREENIDMNNYCSSTNLNLSELLSRFFRIWKKMGHFLHFFKEYLCAETKEIKRKAFATIVTKWTKTFILEKLFVSSKNILNKVLCIIVIKIWMTIKLLEIILSKKF